MGKRYTTRTPFQQRSRRNKKRAYVRIRNRINREAPVLGGKFTTRTYIHGENSWIDACFLGTQRLVFYNLTLQTTLYEYKELVRDQAFALSFKLASSLDRPLFDRAEKNPATGQFVYRLREARCYPELGNLTRLQWCDAQHQAIADSGDIEVMEQWTLHPNYYYGIGLHATVDVPVLSVDVVNAFIDRFLQTEASYRDARSHAYRYDQVPYWGIDSNALIDPLDWEAALEH